jgi:hypothetical protein
MNTTTRITRQRATRRVLRTNDFLLLYCVVVGALTNKYGINSLSDVFDFFYHDVWKKKRLSSTRTAHKHSRAPRVFPNARARTQLPPQDTYAQNTAAWR